MHFNNETHLSYIQLLYTTWHVNEQRMLLGLNDTALAGSRKINV